MLQLWSSYFTLAVSFLTQPCLQLEKFSEAKREHLQQKYGDMRVLMGYEILAMWQNLGIFSTHFPMLSRSFAAEQRISFPGWGGIVSSKQVFGKEHGRRFLEGCSWERGYGTHTAQKFGIECHLCLCSRPVVCLAAGNHKMFFVPTLVGPFLEVTLIPETELRKATLPIFLDMMECENANNGNFKQVSVFLGNRKLMCSASDREFHRTTQKRSPENHKTFVSEFLLKHFGEMNK